MKTRNQILTLGLFGLLAANNLVSILSAGKDQAVEQVVAFASLDPNLKQIDKKEIMVSLPGIGHAKGSYQIDPDEKVIIKDDGTTEKVQEVKFVASEIIIAGNSKYGQITKINLDEYTDEDKKIDGKLITEADLCFGTCSSSMEVDTSSQVSSLIASNRLVINKLATDISAEVEKLALVKKELDKNKKQRLEREKSLEVAQKLHDCEGLDEAKELQCLAKRSKTIAAEKAKIGKKDEEKVAELEVLQQEINERFQEALTQASEELTNAETAAEARRASRELNKIARLAKKGDKTLKKTANAYAVLAAKSTHLQTASDAIYANESRILDLQYQVDSCRSGQASYSTMNFYQCLNVNQMYMEESARQDFSVRSFSQSLNQLEREDMSRLADTNSNGKYVGGLSEDAISSYDSMIAEIRADLGLESSRNMNNGRGLNMNRNNNNNFNRNNNFNQNNNNGLDYNRMNRPASRGDVWRRSK